SLRFNNQERARVDGAGLTVVDGKAHIHAGGGAGGIPNMAPGSLTLGSAAMSYGGGAGWNPNTAGILLETVKDAEIAVNDAGTRVVSLLQYQGDTANRIVMGRDMGWGCPDAVEIRVTGDSGWDRLVIGTTNLWAPGAKFVTLGAGGAAGIMFAN